MTLRYEGGAAEGTNAPQTLVGAGGKAQGLLRRRGGGGPRRRQARHGRALQPRGATAPHAAARASRVHLCDTSSPHFELRHLYVGASRATSAELLSVL